MEFTLAQARALVDVFDGDEAIIIMVKEGDATHHSGEGLYAWEAEYPDEGSAFLGALRPIEE